MLQKTSDFGKSVPFPFRMKYCFLLCPTAKSTDCPAAALLAMTVGEVLAPAHAPFLLHVIANQCKMGTGAHLCGPEKAMQRSDLRPGFSSGKAGAKDAQLVSPRCGNPFSPQGNLASWLLFGQIRDALRIRLKRCFLPCTAAGVTDCPAAALLAMTCRGQRRFCVRKEVLPGESVTTFAFAPSTLFSLRLAELLTRPA